MPNSVDPPTATSHDKLFKTAFRHFLRDLVELIHPELAATLELDQVRFLDEALFADFRKDGHVEPDLVAEARTRDGESRLVLVHVEVEGKYRKTIDRRMPRYSMHLTLSSGKPVVSMVVFLKGGTGGVEIREVATRVGPLEVWRFRYLAFGLSQSFAEDYVDRPQPLAAALAALMRSRVWDKVEHKVRCLKAIDRNHDLELDRRYVLAKIVDTYIELDGDENERFVTQIEEESEMNLAKLEAVTWEDALAECRAKGLAEGLQSATIVSAKRRFGDLPPSLEESIRAIHDPDRLYEALDRILEANSIDELDL